MRTIVFGYGRCGIAAIRTLVAMGAEVPAAVAPSDGTQTEIDRFAECAAAFGIPVWTQPRRQDVAPFLGPLHSARPDLILVWSYTMRLPRPVLALPRLGAVNVHNGLLPEYRGRHVQQWALVNGEQETGLTLHYMDEGFDTGP